MAWSETMSRLSISGGYLIYAGSMGLVAAEVLAADMSVQMTTLDCTSIMSPYRQMMRGPVDVTFTAQLAEKYQWDRTVTGTAGPPPHLGALLALARRHPEEYEKLREGEEILKALGG